MMHSVQLEYAGASLSGTSSQSGLYTKLLTYAAGKAHTILCAWARRRAAARPSWQVCKRDVRTNPQCISVKLA